MCKVLNAGWGKDSCWFMTMGHDMVWKRELSDPSWMGQQRRVREGYNNLLREERKREGPIYCTATKIPFMCSFSGNCAASVPVSSSMCL
jgi:hypothetical protein